MSKAASSIRTTHYAEIPPKHEGKRIMTLCGFRVQKRETTQNKDEVTCFICYEKVHFDGGIKEEMKC